jgi:hypothetical protein
MGYHRPVEAFNVGKQGEFAERVHLQEKGCAGECSQNQPTTVTA